MSNWRKALMPIKVKSKKIRITIDDETYDYSYITGRGNHWYIRGYSNYEILAIAYGDRRHKTVAEIFGVRESDLRGDWPVCINTGIVKAKQYKLMNHALNTIKNKGRNIIVEEE
jgi:hypothetical protein